MRVRKKLTILGSADQTGLKPNLFFLALKLGLSGWVTSLSNLVLTVEVQGEETRVSNYIEQAAKENCLSMSHIRCETAILDEADDGSIKIG